MKDLWVVMGYKFDKRQNGVFEQYGIVAMKFT